MKAHEFLAEADSTKSYEIKRGDTLSRIARDNSTTVNAIMDLNRDNRAIRDRDTIYAGGTIKIPTTSTGTDSDARIKRQGATSADKSDTVAKIGNQEFPLTKGPDAPGANDDMGGDNFGIDDTEWEFPTVELGFGDPGYAPLTGKTHVERRPDGNWYYTSNGVMAKPDVARFAEKRFNGLYVVKSKDIGSQKFPMTKGPGVDKSKASSPDQSDAETERLARMNALKTKSAVKPPAKPEKDQGDKTKKRSTYMPPDQEDISPIATDGWLTDKFGSSRVGRKSGHEGIDLHAPIGTPVLAPNNAKVLSVGNDYSRGKFIILGDDRDNPTHQFMHLDKTDQVKQGDYVYKGDVIATSGNTGYRERIDPSVQGGKLRVRVDPHLHWTKYVNGEKVDASKFVKLPTKP
jgi:murein DD-endopeptidase MepM/ murein hydrolase activator NlpD